MENHTKVPIKIKYSEYVVGCRIGNEIYLHPKLYTEPELYKAVLMHEREHTEGYTLNDFLMDLENHHMKGLKKKFYKFMLKNPKTILGLSPIIRIGGHWVFDATMTAFLTTIILGAYLLLRMWK